MKHVQQETVLRCNACARVVACSLQEEQAQLLSHVAIACFTPSQRLRGMGCTSSRARLEQALLLLKERLRCAIYTQ
jgi:hypothetical protein